MPIVSIPSSIGGISIPGITNVAGGPLAALFGSSNSLTNLQYPRDLGSSQKGHYITFTANQVIQPDSLSVSQITQVYNDITQGDLSSALQDTGTIVSDLATAAKTAVLNIVKNTKNTKPVAYINLYMPDTVSFQYAAEYNSTSLIGAGVDIASKINSGLGSIGEGVFGGNGTGSDITKLLLKSQGLALNPQLQLLFDGINFRSYQLAFTFTPYSAAEADTVKQIIQTFRQYAAPEIRSAEGGLFFNVPCSWNVDFFFNGNRNTNITQVAESVIKSVDVNYAPNGWAAHENGAPVQTTMTLEMQEIALIDRTKITQGY